MNLDLNAKANQSLIGQVIGKSQQAVSKLAKKCDVKADATNGQLLQAIVERLTDEAAGRAGELQHELTVARIRGENMKSELAELSIKEKSGELVPVSVVEPIILRMVTSARQELLTLPSKFAGDMKMLHGVEIDESLVMDRIHDALKHLASNLSADDSELDQESDERVVASTTDDND